MKKSISISALAGIAALALSMTACTDRSNRTERTTDTTTTTTRDSADRHDARDDHDKQEVYQAPGTLAEVKKDTGHSTIEVRKQTVNTDTQKETIPTVEEKHVKADINRMSADEFHKLGLPREAADNVIRYRHEHGNFHSVDELRQVPGVNTAWLNGMRNQLGFSTG